MIPLPRPPLCPLVPVLRPAAGWLVPPGRPTMGAWLLPPPVPGRPVAPPPGMPVALGRPIIGERPDDVAFGAAGARPVDVAERPMGGCELPVVPARPTALLGCPLRSSDRLSEEPDRLVLADRSW